MLRCKLTGPCGMPGLRECLASMLARVYSSCTCAAAYALNHAPALAHLPSHPHAPHSPSLPAPFLSFSVLHLLMGRCCADASALASIGGNAFFVDLLTEADPRVRYYAALFVLRSLVTGQPQAYRRALRQVAARAQQANDERLLCNPYLQVKAMLEQQLVDLRA